MASMAIVICHPPTTNHSLHPLLCFSCPQTPRWSDLAAMLSTPSKTVLVFFPVTVVSSCLFSREKQLEEERIYFSPQGHSPA